MGFNPAGSGQRVQYDYHGHRLYVHPPVVDRGRLIDGCSEVRILAQIIVPLSVPIIATISLFYAVGRWNGFSDALYYTSSPDKFPLQLRLREIIMIDRMSEIRSLEGSMHSTLIPEGIKAASIVFATLPILIPIPFCSGSSSLA